jgi:hypothetical protein
MTNEERDLITSFITRVSGAQAAHPAAPGSVPATLAPLPPVDREADGLINQLMVQYPDARYRLTQTAFVQEHALAAAQNRIQRLEWEVQQARQAVAQAQQQAQQQQQQGSGGFFGGLFGGGRQSAPLPQGYPPQGNPQQGAGPAWNQGGAPQQGYPQPPQYAPPPQQYPPNAPPGMFQRSGSGFLGSALTTAAGVAGGMVAGNALMGLFSGGHGGGLGGGLGSGLGGGAAATAASPWATPEALPEPPIAPQQDYVDQGSWDTGGAAAAPDPGSDWDRQADSSSSWSDGGGNDWGSGGGSDDNA